MKTLYDAVGRQDFHVHTFFSPCAKDPAWTPTTIVRRAEALGIRTVVLTDHYHERRSGFTPPPFYAGVDETCRDHAVRELAALDTPVQVLVSCEIDMIRPGFFTVSEAFAHGLPIALVSSSHYHLKGIDPPAARDPQTIARYVLDRMRAAIAWPPTDILAHPLCALHDALGDFGAVLDQISDADFGDVLAFAAERDVALELRSVIFSEAKEYPEHQARFYRLAREAGCKVAAVSDAHSALTFGRTFDAVPWVEKLGFHARDIIDLDWLRERRGRRVPVPPK